MRGHDVEVLAVLLVPGGGGVGRRELAAQEGLFQLEANEDVQVVGRFVGLDADERRPHVVDGEVECVEAHAAERGRKPRLGGRIKVLPEGPAAADEVLPRPRLRLVNAQGDGLPQRQAEAVGRQALFVDPVSRLVQDAEEGRVEETPVVTRGDAAVVRPQRGAERMGRHVEAAAAEVEADRRGRRGAERLLGGNRVVAGQERGVRAPAAGANGRDQGNELLAEAGQHAADVRRQFLGLVIIQQSVVRRLPVAQRPASCRFSSNVLASHGWN